MITRKQTENLYNKPGKEGVTSKYKGVQRRKDSGNWRAMLGYQGKTIHLGNFETEEEAALAYNAAVDKYLGEYAFKNQIED